MIATLPTPGAPLIEATNDGDTDAFLRTFTAAGVVDDWVVNSPAAPRSARGIRRNSLVNR